MSCRWRSVVAGKGTKKDARPKPRVPSGSPVRERQPLQMSTDRLTERAKRWPKPWTVGCPSLMRTATVCPDCCRGAQRHHGSDRSRRFRSLPSNCTKRRCPHGRGLLRAPRPDPRLRVRVQELMCGAWRSLGFEPETAVSPLGCIVCNGARNAEPRAMFQARGRGVGANNLYRSELR